ncbi:hypothetical protein D9M68_480510 [compost metagenome]
MLSPLMAFRKQRVAVAWAVLEVAVVSLYFFQLKKELITGTNQSDLRQKLKTFSPLTPKKLTRCVKLVSVV